MFRAYLGSKRIEVEEMFLRIIFHQFGFSLYDKIVSPLWRETCSADHSAALTEICNSERAVEAETML